MSIKLDAYAKVNPAPKTADKYLVRLPGLTQAVFKVSSASLPYAQHTEGAIWFLGRPFYLPNARLEAGEWSCSYVEDLTLSGAISISSLERRIGNRRVYVGDIQIFIQDQITGQIPQLVCVLKYAWLKIATPSNLDWSKVTEPVIYTLSFRYNAIKRLY